MTGPRVAVRRVGTAAEPVAVIDDFARDPGGLCRVARAQPFAPAGRHYPGIQAPLPSDYMRAQAPTIAAVMRRIFGVETGISLLEAQFSVVTAAPDTLSIEQRLPHVDGLAPGRLAMIHYLVPGGTDGTGFYRHRATGIETVDADNSAAYFAALNRDLDRAESPPRGYIAGDTPLFEQTALFPGDYNRALIYRSRMLHSGAIAPGAALSPDPAIGRLTVTAFFAV